MDFESAMVFIEVRTSNGSAETVVELFFTQVSGKEVVVTCRLS